ncbi:MAG: hypothetical protein J0L97_08240 [Alphaproteobacteria bacterium]|nr:hypothetical protein [Alphaproteobacteria bacterium]
MMTDDVYDEVYVVDHLGKRWGRLEKIVQEALKGFSEADQSAACDALYDALCAPLRTDDARFQRFLGNKLEEANISEEARQALLEGKNFQVILARLAVLKREQPNFDQALDHIQNAGSAQAAAPRSTWLEEVEREVAQESSLPDL